MVYLLDHPGRFRGELDVDPHNDQEACEEGDLEAVDLNTFHLGLLLKLIVDGMLYAP